MYHRLTDDDITMLAERLHGTKRPPKDTTQRDNATEARSDRG